MAHMAVVKILPAIFKAARTIYDISKQVKANKHQCEREPRSLAVAPSFQFFFIGLSERVQRVVSVIEENSVDYSSSAAMEKALRSLAETLQAGAEFVLKFTDTSIMGRFLHNSDHQNLCILYKN